MPPQFVQLVASNLPIYNLPDLVPWLVLQAPLLFDVSNPVIIITAQKAWAIVGDCDPQKVIINPDPAFPQHPVPAPTLPIVDLDFAVYARQQTFVDLFSNQIMSPVGVSDGGPGLIQWDLGGDAFIEGTIKINTAQGPSGVVIVDKTSPAVTPLAKMSPAVRAWIAGPCGEHLGEQSDILDADQELGGIGISFNVNIDPNTKIGQVEAKFQWTGGYLNQPITGQGDFTLLSNKS